MSLKPGSRLGPYEVLSLIGQGGMGEVYRARDTSLKRDVALKILPDTFTNHPTRVARFRREAALLASLNHAGIAAIYGLVEGADGTIALALELVDGESLANRISRGPLPVTEAVPLARQIALAVAAAHAQGIVHRDLKPHNIVIRTDGTAKVLDFGLAKAIAEDAVNSTGRSVTETAFGTAMGVVLGTPAYMSPEQATGSAVDSRTDIWAFGCVLFEMLSGQRAFEGVTTSETVTAVLTRPPDWRRLPAATPAALRSLLRRCLATDPRRRPPIDAVAFALEDEQAFGSSDSVEVRSPARRSWTMAAAGILVGALLTAAFMWSRAREVTPAVLRTTIPVSASVMGADRSFAFTTDGKRLIYISEDGSEVLARSLDSLESTSLFTTAAYLRGIFPSPDGRSLAFIENSFTLRRMPAAGGTPVTVIVFDGPSRGAVWLPDDTFVFSTLLPRDGPAAGVCGRRARHAADQAGCRQGRTRSHCPRAAPRETGRALHDCTEAGWRSARGRTRPCEPDMANRRRGSRPGPLRRQRAPRVHLGRLALGRALRPLTPGDGGSGGGGGPPRVDGRCDAVRRLERRRARCTPCCPSGWSGRHRTDVGRPRRQ